MKKERYEDLLKELKETVARLEDGSVPLQESLELYEKGCELVAKCEKILEETEARVTLCARIE